MFKHKIYIYKSPKTTKRVGFVVSAEKSEAYETLPEELLRLLKTYHIVTHRLFTDKDTVESIVSLDPFFENIEFYKDANDFSNQVKKINENSLPTPIEFSKILLTKVSLDKLQLQKVLYLIYSICLEKGEKIFNESPVAYRYGPVFEDVYQEFKYAEKNEKISEELSIDQRILLSKTLNAETSTIIENVIEKVKDKTGGNLINITHAEGGPWKQVYIDGANNIIDDDTILKYNYKVQKKLS